MRDPLGVELQDLERWSLAYRRGLDPAGMAALSAAAQTGAPTRDPEEQARWTLALEPLSTTRGQEQASLRALSAAAETLASSDEGASPGTPASG